MISILPTHRHLLHLHHHHPSLVLQPGNTSVRSIPTMTCGNKGCKIKAKINPKSGLCPSCDEFVQGVNRRVESLDRRQQARDMSHAARRDLGGDQVQQNQESQANAPPPPPGNNLFNFPNPSTSKAPLPNVDLNDIIKSCEDAKNGSQVNTGKVLGEMLGMIVHMYAKQSENDAMKDQVHSNTDCISHLEAKVGDSNDVAYPRSIAIRKLPLPPHGVTELQNVQHYLKEIKAEGVDVARDCVKAIRKESMKHNPDLGPNLGTVLVELRNEEIRGKIMKSKKNLMNHPALVLQNLIIKNALTPGEMKSQNTHLGMLKMITGSNDFFIAGNGMIRQKNQQSFQNENQSTQNQPRMPGNQNPQNQTNRPQFPQAGPARFQTAPIRSVQPQVRNSQPHQQHNSYPPQMFQQGRPTSFQTNFPPPQMFQQSQPTSFQTNFPPFSQFQFPSQLPVINPLQAQAAAKPNETPANPLDNLLDFDFTPIQPASESRPGSAQSARSPISDDVQQQVSSQMQ